jgi:hypothetical protein
MVKHWNLSNIGHNSRVTCYCRRRELKNFTGLSTQDTRKTTETGMRTFASSMQNYRYEQNQWLSGLCPSSGTLIKHNVSEAGSARGGRHLHIIHLLLSFGLSLGSVLLRRAFLSSVWLGLGPSRVGVSFLPPEDGNRSSFRNTVFCNIRIPDKGQSPETKWFWVLRTIVRTL